MRITFHGAAQTVTGSQHLLEVNGQRLLLECGLYQGRRKEAFKRNRNFPFDPLKIDAVLLSHAHIDHSGNLPHLVKKGYRGPIYATDATAHLANIMLIEVEPLYTIEDASQVAQYFECQPYDHSFEVVPGVRAQLVEAGHILGSAAIVLDIEENGRHFRLWFSGDIGRRDLPLLRDPVLPNDVDYMIMECTYGDKTHQNPQASYDELEQVIIQSIEREGKVIIPSFAVGRTQELVYCLHRMIDGGEIPRIPVYIDSPLAVNISDIFRAHPECFDEKTHEFMRNDVHRSFLGEGLLTYVRSVEGSKAINDDHGPMVIISASGMAEAGRILHHLRNNIEDPRNTILIVSWQAPHTLGRRLADRVSEVKIFGEVFKRRARVVTIGGFSAHAGQPFLLEYALESRRSLKRIFLVHGEQRGADPLTEKLAEQGFKNVRFPKLHSSVEI
jgi:metallo-beta-lactamase family protein